MYLFKSYTFILYRNFSLTPACPHTAIFLFDVSIYYIKMCESSDHVFG